MTFLTAIAWLKEHWKQVWGVATVLLLLGMAELWKSNGRLQGALSQCQASELAMEKELDASANMVQELRAKVNAKCKGSVDFTVGAPTEWNSLMNPPTYPCPKVTFHADMDGSTDMDSAGAVSSTASSKITEKPGPGKDNTPDAWGLSVGGGVSLPYDSVWHGSAAIDYKALRAIGTLDTKGTWTAGAQVKVLTWNWP